MKEPFEHSEVQLMRGAFEELAAAACEPGTTEDTVFIEVHKDSVAASYICEAFQMLSGEDGAQHPLQKL